MQPSTSVHPPNFANSLMVISIPDASGGRGVVQSVYNIKCNFSSLQLYFYCACSSPTTLLTHSACSQSGPALPRRQRYPLESRTTSLGGGGRHKRTWLRSTSCQAVSGHILECRTSSCVLQQAFRGVSCAALLGSCSKKITIVWSHIW